VITKRIIFPQIELKRYSLSTASSLQRIDLEVRQTQHRGKMIQLPFQLIPTLSCYRGMTKEGEVQETVSNFSLNLSISTHLRKLSKKRRSIKSPNHNTNYQSTMLPVFLEQMFDFSRLVSTTVSQPPHYK